MKKLTLLLAVALLCFGFTAQGQVKYPAKGDMAPDFTVTMFDGSQIKLSDLRGKVVVINFWATWCPPCRAEFKRVEADLIKRFEGKDFVFLPISRGESNETVGKFRTQNNYSFPMGLDPQGQIFNMYAKDGIPRNFVVGKDGVLTLVETGYTAELFDHMVSHIDELLKIKK